MFRHWTTRQYRTVLSEGRETKGEPYCCPSFLPGTLSRQLDRKENQRQRTELGRQGSEPERLRQLEAVGKVLEKGGARRVRTGKHRVKL